MTHRDFKKRAGDVAASRRPSNGGKSVAATNLPDPEILEAADDGRLVDLAMYRALLTPALEKNAQRPPMALVDDPPIDTPARERGLRLVDELHERVAEAELVMATLGGFIGERSLGSAAINSTAIKLGEAREQLPVLRQAVRDMERGS